MKLRIEIELDSLQEGDSSTMKAIQVLAASLTGDAPAASEPAPAKTPTAPKKTVAQEANLPKADPAPGAKPGTPQASGPAIADVRTALSQKVEAHRDKIKAKLTELGAQNVSTLAPEKYAEMLDFLNALD